MIKSMRRHSGMFLAGIQDFEFRNRFRLKTCRNDLNEYFVYFNIKQVFIPAFFPEYIFFDPMFFGTKNIKGVDP